MGRNNRVDFTILVNSFKIKKASIAVKKRNTETKYCRRAEKRAQRLAPFGGLCAFRLGAWADKINTM